MWGRSRPHEAQRNVGRRSGISSQLEKLLRILAIHLVLLRVGEAELVDQVDAFALEHEQRRRIGAEQKQKAKE